MYNKQTRQWRHTVSVQEIIITLEKQKKILIEKWKFDGIWVKRENKHVRGEKREKFVESYKMLCCGKCKFLNFY